ncbi:uncharacterized protein [Spinacia oleracea]|uniref:Tudor domain-containing protein n=1 Tax=Spinacia oleracea TaxID=3562 RepID=A0ABM3R4U7_SPIOL|nr:uncharacterized protein LOC130465815 [Spinacia oleracea]
MYFTPYLLPFCNVLRRISVFFCNVLRDSSCSHRVINTDKDASVQFLALFSISASSPTFFLVYTKRDSRSEIVYACSFGWFLESTHCCMLMQVQDELVSSIKDAEEGLFHLKRARLLREVDSAVQDSIYSHKDAAVELINPAKLGGSQLPCEDLEVEPLDSTNVEAEILGDPSYFIGSKCRFRHTDGRWYNGQIVQLDGSSSARVSFLNPTSEKMMQNVDP